jgi:hypothetical protein
MPCCRTCEEELIGIRIGLGVLVSLAFRGWSILLLAPAAASIAAVFGSF